MIHPARVQLVELLLSERKHSYRTISRLTGVSRGSISMIAAGRRPDYQATRRQDPDDDWQPTGPIMRCPKCGGRVFSPCRLCHVRNETNQPHKRKQRLPGK